jgi:hypothetical protein
MGLFGGSVRGEDQKCRTLGLVAFITILRKHLMASI